MERLRALDQIAYIRFASVYQSFDDLEQLKREVDTLYAERAGRRARADQPGARRAAPERASMIAPGTLPPRDRCSAPMSVLSDRDIRAAVAGRPRAHRPLRCRAASSRRRWTCTWTATSGSSATTATRTSTCASRSPT